MIEDTIFQIEKRMWKYCNINDAARAIEPLKWYITTGRVSTEFIKALQKANSRQLTTIAKRLHKLGGWNYDESIQAVTSYIL